MATVNNTQQVTASDRLGFSMFFAAVLHAMVIFGLGFGLHFSGDSNVASMLEVTMVLTKTHQAPLDAEHIASENQLESGMTDSENQPSAPFTGNSLLDTNGIAPVDMRPSQTSSSSDSEQQEPVLVREIAETAVNLEKQSKDISETKNYEEEINSEQKLEVAKLVAELHQEEQNYSKRPKINYIDTLSAKTAVEASYVLNWVERVERIGNLNYPEEIRNNSLSGTLVLSVLLNSNGETISVEIQSSAGKSILDEAAKRIVRYASPFKPFPEEMHSNYDQLMITRTWVFGKNNTLITE